MKKVYMMGAAALCTISISTTFLSAPEISSESTVAESVINEEAAEKVIKESQEVPP